MSYWRSVSFARVPSVPGCYAVYAENGLLLYIGSAKNLRDRLTRHGMRFGACARVKVKLSRRRGDWLMDEYRLIARLAPPQNVHYKPHPRPLVPLRADIVTPW